MKNFTNRGSIKGILLLIMIIALCFSTPALAGTATATSDANSVAVTGDSSATGGAASATAGEATASNGNQETTVGGQSIDSHDTYEAADIEKGRGFHVAPDVAYGPLVGPVQQTGPSSEWQDVRSVLTYRVWYTEGALESLAKKGDVKSKFMIADDNIELAKDAGDKDKTRWIKIVIQFPKKAKKGGVVFPKYTGKGHVMFRGFSNASSDKPGTNMVEVMAAGALDAVRAGCNVYVINAQGSVRDAFASGWGIGFHTSQAQLFTDGLHQSNVSSGGTGYSSGRGKSRDLPYLQAAGLVDYDLVYPKLRKAGANK